MTRHRRNHLLGSVVVSVSCLLSCDSTPITAVQSPGTTPSSTLPVATGGTQASTTTAGTVPTGTGGSSVAVTPGSGGTSAKGGTTSTGGTTAKGGTTASGGTSAKGGTTASGGTSAKGGTTAAGGTTSTGGTTTKATTTTNSGITVTPVTNGTSGKTTRYWDCCKPSCGWSANASQGGKSAAKSCGKDGTSQVGADVQSSCNNGGAFQCYWGAPWSVSDTVSYGFAATGGGNSFCGKCFQLDFTGTGATSSSSALKGKSLIVQAINIGGDVVNNQFDLLIPGGGVGINNSCTSGPSEWGSVDIGAQSGGMLATCNGQMSCVQTKCQSAFKDKPLLLAGCDWFTTWFNAADNPNVTYKEVPCPSAITAKSGM